MSISVVDGLIDAINAHDIDKLASCFAPDFSCAWPVHPMRSFSGSEQVRRNWQMLFDARPTIKATVTSRVRSGDEMWMEWELTGEDRDDVPFRELGIVIVRVDGDLIVRSTFYMEPVEKAEA